MSSELFDGEAAPPRDNGELVFAEPWHARVFALGVITPPTGWDIGAGALRVLGALLMLGAVAYLLLCARSRRREWTLRGHVVTLPPIGLALRQLALSCANWLTSPQQSSAT